MFCFFCIIDKQFNSNSNYIWTVPFMHSSSTQSFLSLFSFPPFYFAKYPSQLNCHVSVFTRSQAAPLSSGSTTSSSHQRDLACNQREKRAAPQPPAVNQSQNGRTLSVSPQRRLIVSDGQTMSGPVTEFRHGKGPAPSRPSLAESKTTLSAENAPSTVEGILGNKAAGFRSLNPFEDDMDDGDLTESTVRSAKKSRAPPLPANTVKQNSVQPADSLMQSSVSEPLGQESRLATGERKEGPFPATRR